MSLTKITLDDYKKACNFPGRLDETVVEAALGKYLAALKITRKIVRIRSGWELSDYPSLEKNISFIVDDFSRRNAPTNDARAAWDARDASAARDASGVKRFASWCIFGGGWWRRWDLSWIAVTEFGARQIKKDEVQEWSAPILDAFINGAWLFYWTEDILYWCSKPTVRTDNARLHCADGPALESDIENLYFWQGVLVPAFVVVKPEWITVEDIEKEQNAEVRRVMMERFGISRYIQETNSQLLAEDTDIYGRARKLWRKEVQDDEPLVMIQVVNSTPEPDGKMKDYFIRVPPIMATPQEAVAWTFGMSPKDYQTQVET